MLVKGGAVVDPDSGLDNCASVATDFDGRLLTAVLGLVDLVRGSNSYYKCVDTNYLLVSSSKHATLSIICIIFLSGFKFCALMTSHASIGYSDLGVVLVQILVGRSWSALLHSTLLHSISRNCFWRRRAILGVLQKKISSNCPADSILLIWNTLILP